MKTSWTVALVGLLALQTLAAPSRVVVQVDQPGHPVSPLLWGVFFEDINLSADGGIYPELVRNLSFEDAATPDYWKITTSSGNADAASIDTTQPLNPMNRSSLKLKLDAEVTLVNEGYWGMNLAKGEKYKLRLAARGSDGFTGPISIKLVGDKPLAGGEIKNITDHWQYYDLDLTPQDSHPKARLEISAKGKGNLYLDMVSLLPEKRWKKSGLRPDLAEAVQALKPSFLRFPGGCWVEGENMSRMYNWKKTIGDVGVRVPLYNIWQYYATHGLGFHEYLQMAEDLGAEPLFCINTGMSHKETVPMDLMDQWVQDALDAIEYANGPTNTVWGGRRALNGHPEPFNLKYLEIGNENGGPAYRERWPLFVKAIKSKYPEVQLIANHWQGGYPKDPMPTIVDEHYYNTPEWFMRAASHYDNYDRKGPKIFVGEYAVTREGGLGNLRAAIGEAAFMTGLERNSDIVAMAAYAPLFCNANHKRWPVNLINFDSSRWFGLPGYYVQKLFSEHRGDITLGTTAESVLEQAPMPSGCIGVGTWNTSAEFKDIKVTAPDGKVLFTSDFTSGSSGWTMLGGGKWSVSDGALRQTAEREFVRALAGDRLWTNYTLELKARKLSGREGFLVLFHIKYNDDRIWWNVGGWNNSRHGVEIGETMDPKPGQIETGKWYDLKVEARGETVKCWLDGKLIHEVSGTLPQYKTLFASSTLEKSSGDVIVKIVNSSFEPREIDLSIKGAKSLAGSGEAIVLTSADAKDENTLDEPTKVSPKSDKVSISGGRVTRTLPPNSFTVLRVKSGR